MGEPLVVRDLGRIEFEDAHRLQLELVAKRRSGECPDTLLLCEHGPVVTLGRATGEAWRHGEASGCRAGARTPPAAVDSMGGVRAPAPPGYSKALGGVQAPALQTFSDRSIPVHRIERGGEATYHGPGQLVAYPILDLRERGRDIHAYLRDLEEVVLRALGDFGVVGERREGFTGVWVGGAKIAAIGVAIRRWVTFHGLALNIDCDLDVFRWIVPCGIPGCRTTTVAQELGAPVSLTAVKPRLVASFMSVFCRHGAELLGF